MLQGLDFYVISPELLPQSYFHTSSMSLNWFKKSRKKRPDNEIRVTKLKSIDYPAKIILAWAKAIEGDKQFQLWLKTNGYEELYIACYAIYLRKEARDWLTANGYAHLMAMIHAAEGNASAQNWLVNHGFELLYHIALSVEDETESWQWLKENASPDLYLLAVSIKKIKDQIEENHNDVHSFGKDY